MSVNEINKQWNETFQRAHAIEQALQNVRANIVNSFVQMDQKMLIDSFSSVQLMSDIQDFEYYQKSQLPSPISMTDNTHLQNLKPSPKPKGIAKNRDTAFALIRDYPNDIEANLMVPDRPQSISMDKIDTPLQTKNGLSSMTMACALLKADPINRVHNGSVSLRPCKESNPDRVTLPTPQNLKINIMAQMAKDEQQKGSEQKFISKIPQARLVPDIASLPVDRKPPPILSKQETIQNTQSKSNVKGLMTPQALPKNSPQLPQENSGRGRPILLQARGHNPVGQRFQSAQRTFKEEKESAAKQAVMKQMVPILENGTPQDEYHQRMRERINQETRRLQSKNTIDTPKLVAVERKPSVEKPMVEAPKPLTRIKRVLSPAKELGILAKPRLTAPSIPRSVPVPEERFSKGRFLGKGKFGDVYEAYDRLTYQVVALKIIHKAIIVRYGLVDLLAQEIKIQSYLDHPNVLKLYGVVQDDKKIMLVLELGHQDALKELKGKGAPQQILLQVTKALEYVHSKSVIHRDLKIENVVMVNNQAKLADFGLAIRTRPIEKVFEFCGTPGYIAPEVTNNKGYDTSADVYSLGVLFHEALFGSLPETPLKHNKDQELTQLLNHMLEPDPSKRISAYQALQHPWLRKLELNTQPTPLEIQLNSLLTSSLSNQ